jgi:hypothetical protein
LLREGCLVKAVANAGNDDLRFLLEPGSFNHLGENLDREFAILLNLIFQRDD